jgi:hypothetical protein
LPRSVVIRASLAYTWRLGRLRASFGRFVYFGVVLDILDERYGVLGVRIAVA